MRITREKILGFKVTQEEGKLIEALPAQYDRDDFSSFARYIFLGLANGKLSIVKKK